MKAIDSYKEPRPQRVIDFRHLIENVFTGLKRFKVMARRYEKIF